MKKLVPVFLLLLSACTHTQIVGEDFSPERGGTVAYRDGSYNEAINQAKTYCNTEQVTVLSIETAREVKRHIIYGQNIIPVKKTVHYLHFKCS